MATTSESALAGRRPVFRRPEVLGVLAATVVGLGLRVAFVVRTLPVLDRLFVPDDTYYTLTIARSLADGHGPTFDGIRLTSGFQPLLGFLMTPVFWFTDSTDIGLRVDLVLLVLIDTLTILVLAWVAYRLAGRVGAVLAAVIWALSPVAISMALGGLETSLAILTQVGLVAIWIHARDRGGTVRWVIVGVIAGLAVLARIDALALVGLLALLQLWRGPRRELLAAGIAGVVVLAPWWIYCVVTFGTPFPTSGTAVHELAPFGSFSRESMSLAVGAAAGGPFGIWDWARSELIADWTLGAVVFWIVVIALLALTAAWLRVAHRDPDRDVWTVAPALPAFAAVLLLFYAWFGVSWYFTRYLAPVAWIVTVVLAITAGALSRRVVGSTPTTNGRGWIPVAIGAALVVVVLGFAVRTDVRWLTNDRETKPGVGAPRAFDAATGFRDGVLAVLPSVPDGSTVAGWQSGALGYYGQGRTVVNLDGAVNPDTAGKSVPELARYLRDEKIEGIVDVPLVVTRLALAVQELEPRAQVDVVTTAPGTSPVPYQYARIVWPAESSEG